MGTRLVALLSIVGSVILRQLNGGHARSTHPGAPATEVGESDGKLACWWTARLPSRPGELADDSDEVVVASMSDSDNGGRDEAVLVLVPERQVDLDEGLLLVLGEERVAEDVALEVVSVARSSRMPART